MNTYMLYVDNDLTVYSMYHCMDIHLKHLLYILYIYCTLIHYMNCMYVCDDKV